MKNSTYITRRNSVKLFIFTAIAPTLLTSCDSEQRKQQKRKEEASERTKKEMNKLAEELLENEKKRK